VRYSFPYKGSAHSPGLQKEVTLQFGANSILKLFCKLLCPGVIFVIEDRTNTSQILPTITYICLTSSKGRKLYSHTYQNVTAHRITTMQQYMRMGHDNECPHSWHLPREIMKSSISRAAFWAEMGTEDFICRHDLKDSRVAAYCPQHGKHFKYL
jgi:hypothetical protein